LKTEQCNNDDRVETYITVSDIQNMRKNRHIYMSNPKKLWKTGFSVMKG